MFMEKKALELELLWIQLCSFCAPIRLQLRRITYCSEDKIMNRTSATALAFSLLLGFFCSVSSADELISKSGAARSFFAPGYEAFHLESQYSGGMVQGEGHTESKAVYEFYLPGNEGAERLISSITVRIFGSGHKAPGRRSER